MRITTQPMRKRPRARRTPTHEEEGEDKEDPTHEEEGEDKEDPTPPVLKKPASRPGPKPKGCEEKKKTFARRYKPQHDILAAKRWDSIKDAFELRVSPRVKKAPSLEDWGCGLVLAD